MDDANPCLMTVDVEDWFHADNLREVVPRECWDQRERRVVENTRHLLTIFGEHDVTATFFVLGWVAERTPFLIKEIHETGHEVASHGHAHRLAYTHGEEELREDIRRSKAHLEEVTGTKVLGYRAPNFSVSPSLLRILAEEGFEYDSSYFPSSLHDRYGKLGPLNGEAGAAGEYGIKEIVVSTLRLGHIHLPWGGGGYFRAAPYLLFRKGVRRILRKRGYYIFYIHPWEIDPGQPRPEGLSISSRFRHYVGVESTRDRLMRLLEDFNWCSIRDSLESGVL